MLYTYKFNTLDLINILYDVAYDFIHQANSFNARAWFVVKLREMSSQCEIKRNEKSLWNQNWKIKFSAYRSYSLNTSSVYALIFRISLKENQRIAD